MANYNYDESGNMAAYFVLTFLSIFLIPYTLASFSSSASESAVAKPFSASVKAAYQNLLSSQAASASNVSSSAIVSESGSGDLFFHLNYGGGMGVIISSTYGLLFKFVTL